MEHKYRHTYVRTHTGCPVYLKKKRISRKRLNDYRENYFYNFFSLWNYLNILQCQLLLLWFFRKLNDGERRYQNQFYFFLIESYFFFSFHNTIKFLETNLTTWLNEWLYFKNNHYDFIIDHSSFLFHFSSEFKVKNQIENDKYSKDFFIDNELGSI